MVKNSFIFYRSFYEAISLLSDKSKIKIYSAICKVAFDEEEELELTENEKAIMSLIKSSVSKTNKEREYFL